MILCLRTFATMAMTYPAELRRQSAFSNYPWRRTCDGDGEAQKYEWASHSETIARKGDHDGEDHSRDIRRH